MKRFEGGKRSEMDLEMRVEISGEWDGQPYPSASQGMV